MVKSAAMVGLGLALAQPERPVVVFTGDGEMLMGLGAFCTIAQHRPDNLSIVVLDNEQYAETGMQTTATGFGTDLAAVARACGLEDARTLRSDADLAGLRESIHAGTGTLVAVLKIAPGDQPRTVPLRDGAAIADGFIGHCVPGYEARMMVAVGGATDAASQPPQAYRYLFRRHASPQRRVEPFQALDPPPPRRAPAPSRSVSSRDSSPAIIVKSESKRSAASPPSPSPSFITSSGVMRLSASVSVSTNEMRSAQVIARRVHCLPSSMCLRTSAASIDWRT